MTILAAPSFPLLVGESDADRLERILREYSGCSLTTGRDKLAALVGRGVDDESIVEWTTNCATFALGLIAACGCPHPLLRQRLPNGMAFTRLVSIGNELGAWRFPNPDGSIPKGFALWYKIDNENDDHCEFALEPPDEHGGGGRANNEITIVHGNEHESWSRPIHRLLDVNALGFSKAMSPITPDPAAGT